MAKYYLIKILVFLMSILLLTGIVYCYLFGHEKSNKIVVENFEKSISDTLIPNDRRSYSAHILKIRGIVNDTIIVQFHGNHRFKGKIDTLINFLDYYGGYKVGFKFIPNKSTSGKLIIEHSIQ